MDVDWGLIMDGIIAAIIGGASGVVCSVIAVIGSQHSVKTKIIETNADLTNQHGELYNKFTKEHTELSDQLKPLSDVKDNTNFVKDEVIRIQEWRKTLSQTELNANKVSEHFTALVELVSDVKMKNNELTEQLEKLHKENVLLKQEVRKLRHEKSRRAEKNY